MFDFLIPLFLVSFIPFSLSRPLVKRAFSDGPVITANFPDPGLISVGSTYYAFATNNGQQNTPVATSEDFITWTVTGQDALPNLPSWSSGATWAPDPVQLVSFVIDGSLEHGTLLTTNRLTGPLYFTSLLLPSKTRPSIA